MGHGCRRSARVRLQSCCRIGGIRHSRQDGLPARLRSTAQALSALSGIVYRQSHTPNFSTLSSPACGQSGKPRCSFSCLIAWSRIACTRETASTNCHHLRLAGSNQPGCPDGYAGPRPVATAPRSARSDEAGLDAALRRPIAQCDGQMRLADSQGPISPWHGSEPCGFGRLHAVT